jgi:hypothetical protein
VDGSSEEWDVVSLPPPDGSGDFIANLYHSGQTVDKDVLGKVYLRYSCVADGPNQLYALVQAEADLTLASVGTDGENFIKYRSPDMQNFVKGVDDAATEQFAFVGSPETGWEAMIELPPDVYELDVHTNVNYDGGSQTAAAIDLSVTLACSPTSVSMTDIGAAAAGASRTMAVVAIGFLMMATAAAVYRRPATVDRRTG